MPQKTCNARGVSVQPLDQYHRQLGRKLAAAVISQHAGIGLDYAFRKYTSEETVGALWIEAAKLLSVLALAGLESPTK
jgi:hypothetical protein